MYNYAIMMTKQSIKSASLLRIFKEFPQHSCGFCHTNWTNCDRPMLIFAILHMDLTEQRGFDKDGKFIGHMKTSQADWIKRKYPGPIQNGV